jgi:quercetin dioxygenase-like cupin family protein
MGSVRLAIVLGVYLGLVASSIGTAAAQSTANQHVIQCRDSPTPGVRPANMECALIVHKSVSVLPRAPIMVRFERFDSMAAAHRAEHPASVVVRAGGKIWLLSLVTKGAPSRGGTFVAEVGPISIPRAGQYKITVGEAYVDPGALTRSHVHPGPEAWYLLAGQQCLEMPDRVVLARAKQATFAPANTPMNLTVTGTTKRDALFVVIGDAAQPWTKPANWKPRGRCALRSG